MVAAWTGTSLASSRLFVFSPDWRPTDFADLATKLQPLFERGGLDVIFQGFARYEDFAEQAKATSPEFLLAPAWLDGPEAGDLGLDLRVIARARRAGKSTYRKALMARASTDSVDDLSNRAIATTLYSMGRGSEAAALDSFHMAPETAKVVAVAKDVDALLALVFGHVDAALVTSRQYDLLEESNPTEAEALQVLALSREIRLPAVFAGSEASGRDARKMTKLLENLPETAEGREILAALGFDAFATDAPSIETSSSRPGPRR